MAARPSNSSSETAGWRTVKVLATSSVTMRNMQTFEIVLLLLAGVLISNLISQRFPKVPTPLVQIALGILLVLLPLPFAGGSIDSNLFLVLFIAPLLFEEAKKTDKPALWRLKRPVLSLAIGLVFATCMTVGFTLHWLVPSIPLAAAFAFAAALAPTDAVAVLSLRETSTISAEKSELLKDEALLNDAASIVSFQFAIAAVLTSTFSLVDASISFVVMFVGGLAVGVGLMLVRYLLMRAITKSGIESSTFFVLFEIITPSLVYLMAELLQVSGIMAVVAAGITYSFTPKGHSPISARNRIVSSSVWALLNFTLNGLVFLLLGAQFPQIILNIHSTGLADLGWLSLDVVIMMAVILVVRFFWILVMNRHRDLRYEWNERPRNEEPEEQPSNEEPEKPSPAAVITTQSPQAAAPPAYWLPGRFQPHNNWSTLQDAATEEPEDRPFSIARTAPTISREERRARRRQARLLRRQAQQEAHQAPGYWRRHLHDALLMTLAGPKGAITLALVFAIPVLLPSGDRFPDRDIIMFLASGVILLSLILTSSTLPFISPKRHQAWRPTDEVRGMVEILHSAAQRLLENCPPADRMMAVQIARQYNERIQRLLASSDIDDSTDRQLLAQFLTWERQHTLSLLRSGRVGFWTAWLYLIPVGRQFAHLQHQSGLLSGLANWFRQFAVVWQNWRQRQPAPPTPPATNSTADVPATGAAATDALNQPSKRLGLLSLRRENLQFGLRRQQELRRGLAEIQAEYPPSAAVARQYLTDLQSQLSRLALRFQSRLHLLAGSAEPQARREQQRLRLSIRALELEREAINNAVLADQISRGTARQMMDNVSAMELDIEEFLE